MTKSFGIYSHTTYTSLLYSLATLKGSHSEYIHTNIYRDTKVSSQLMNVSWVY